MSAPAGWPRPMVEYRGKSLPWPWVAQRDNFGLVDDARQQQCSSGTICQVCGEGFNGRAYALVNWDSADGLDIRPDRKPEPGDKLPAGKGIQAMDLGLLHGRCVDLARQYCPLLRSLDARGALLIAEVDTGIGVEFFENVEFRR